MSEIDKINKYFNVDDVAKTLHAIKVKRENSPEYLASKTQVQPMPENSVSITYRPNVYLSAGFGVEVYDESAEALILDSSILMSERGLKINPKHCEIVKVSGNSMSPEYQHGDRVIIDKNDKNLTDGQIYAIRYDNAI